MRDVLLPSMLAISVGWVGCSTTALNVQEHAPAVAELTGVAEESVEFVSYADLISFPVGDESDAAQALAEEHFSADTKGLVALTDEALLWANGNIEDGTLKAFTTIDVSRFSYAHVADEGGLLIHAGDQIIVIRPHSWSKYKGDLGRAVELGSKLGSLGIDTDFPSSSGLSPRFFRNDRSIEADYNSSAYAAEANEIRDQNYADWVGSFGQDGVPLTPP